eukprot:909618-Rhodomonas_salina.4
MDGEENEKEGGWGRARGRRSKEEEQGEREQGGRGRRGRREGRGLVAASPLSVPDIAYVSTGHRVWGT